MAPSLPDEVRAALDAGALYFVNDAGVRYSLPLHELLALGPCWAHLRDPRDDRWYVHPVRAAADVTRPPMLKFFQSRFPLVSRTEANSL